MAFHLLLLHKELKDKRQIEAIEDLFNKADKNYDGKISISDYVEIFSTHGITLRWGGILWGPKGFQGVLRGSASEGPEGP